MSEKRFTLDSDFVKVTSQVAWDNQEEKGLTLTKLVDLLNEQQDKITELEKNFDDLVEWASEISKRNVVLDEQVGELQRENEQLKEENASLKQRIRDIKYNNCV